ncbi:hypothetical protein HK405_010667, partial [Cladochytrium tenue]
MVRQLSTNWFAQTTVGGKINNALCISSHQGQARLLICNNDETLKVYSLPGLQLITKIPLPSAVNYAAVSPDGRRLAAVGDLKPGGDSKQVYLFDISASGTYQRVATFSAADDSCFSCAWNQTSDKLAVASQNGFVTVWDVRSTGTAKLAEFGSKQRPQGKGACRCVKFSPSGAVDLMVYSEHVSVFNVIDARTFNERQVVRVAPPNMDQDIAGFTFSPDGKAIFVGLENQVLEYDVD